MLSLNPTSLMFGEKATHVPGPDIYYSSDELRVTVTALPLHGTVVKKDASAKLHLAEIMTVAELAGLRFISATNYSKSASGPGIERCSNESTLYVAQNAGPTPIRIRPPNGFGASAVRFMITELPSNGSVLLSDEATVVTPMRMLSIAQLNGLMFRPAAGACGKISILQYGVAAPDSAITVAVTDTVLLVVGPDAPPPAVRRAAAQSSANIGAPIAVALLLDAALSSSNSAASQADQNDVSPDDVLAQPRDSAGLMATPFSDATIGMPSDIVTELQIAQTSTTAHPTADTTTTASPDSTRIGSSTPPSAATPPSTVLQGSETISTASTAPASSVSLSAAPLSETTTSSISPLIVAAPTASTQSFSPAPSTTAAAAPTIAAATTATTNPVAIENQKPGTPRNIWQVAPGADSTTIQGFTTAFSTNVGGEIDFKINNQTGNPNYHIDIYRIGYYGGNGARLITTIQHQAATSVLQPAPVIDRSTGEVDAGNWSITDRWSLPAGTISGVYVANVIDGTQVFQIPFVIRDDSSHSDIVYQTSDETWEAYNGWGGANLYGGNGPGNGGAAYAVSYNRPIVTRDGIGTNANIWSSFFGTEFPAVEWMEQNGYDVSYISGLDTATSGSLLLNHKIFMDAGHDEYWTETQRANVQAAADAGVNLAFMTGNEIFWKTRFAPSIDGSATANRTLVSYKDTLANALIDPTGTATGNFSDPRFGPPLPANSLTGTVFQVNAFRNDTITIPFGMTQLRVWRNTSIAQTSPGQTASLTPGLLGIEWNSSPDNGFRPIGLIALSSTTLQVPGALLDFGDTFGPATATHNLVEYRNPISGALVFGAGSIDWSWGLAADHDSAGVPADPNVQQAMVNLFADMGVQPATLAASLRIASQSTDHTPPTSAISNVSARTIVEGQSVTVTGTASDVGGLIGGVVVSSDGGITWHPASGSFGSSNVTWSYSFKAGPPATLNIKSRAVDDSLNLETPAAGVPLTITPSSSLTIFSATDTPAITNFNDAGSVELGVKFTSATSGLITGIRFYKGSQNTGTHIGDLWTSSGTLLASATFANETASGWQQVNFATPVQIQPGVTYIASYHTNVGHYSITDFYFDNGLHSNGALTATSNGLNGVYAYGPGPIFPGNVSIIKGDNYWVDVVFNDGGSSGANNPPIAVNDSGFTTAQNTALNITSSALLANDSDPNGDPLAVTGVSGAVNGTASFNAQTNTVTFTPTTGYTGAASFTYAISDGRGGTATASASLTVNASSPAGTSLFTASSTPAQTNLNDGSPIEVGVKFTSSAAGQITALRFYRSASDTGSDLLDLWTATGTKLASATFTNTAASGWQTVTLATPVAISANTTYVASYHTTGAYVASGNFFTTAVTSGTLMSPSSTAAGGNGVYAYGGTNTAGIFPTNSFNAANYWADVVFTASTGGGSTVSLFSSNPTPSITSANDPNSVELGFKFQASGAGDITGIRFYKGAANTGTHIADLWSSTGTLLATATFTNETATGWQQVNFASPVAINPGTTYIASYHTAGNYAADLNLFANTITNGPLTAPSSASSGGNGVYGYGSGSLFPTNSFNSTSYGVDVLFRPQLAAAA